MNSLPLHLDSIPDFVEDSQSQVSVSLQKESFYSALAIKFRVAMHPKLIELLDNALSGEIANFEEIQPYLPGDNDLMIPKITHWDGTIGGYEIDFSPEMLWCTLRDYYGWGILNKDGLNFIQNHLQGETLIEFGQGTGYNTKLLESHNIHVLSSDIPDNKSFLGLWRNPDCDNGFDLIKEHEGKTIFISWPDPKIDTDFFKTLPKNQKLIIGGNLEFCGLNEKILTTLGYQKTSQSKGLTSCTGQNHILECWIKQ